MAINYPTSLDNFINPTGTDLLENSNAALDHDVQHSNANDAIEALQAKVGVNSSAVTTSHDYKLSEVTSTDKAVGKTATQTLTNKTLTSPTVTGMTATTSTVNGVTLVSSGGGSDYLANDGTYKTVSAGDASYVTKGSVQGLTDAATSGLVLSSGVISVNSGTGANNIVKLNSSSQLPAVDGSLLTGLSVNYQQEFPIYNTSSTGAATSFKITSETNGNTLYSVFSTTTGGGTVRVQRYTKDTNTAQYYMTHDVNNSNIAGGFSLTADGLLGVCVLGNYVYVAAHGNSTSYLTRFDKADLTNATTMTISGTAFGSGIINAFSDGTDIFIYTSANTYYRYTISGTTATNAATVTFTSGGTPSGSISDGTNVWMITGGVIRKYAKTGGSATASYTSLLDTYSSAYTTVSGMNLIITKSGLLGYVIANSIHSNTAVTGAVAKIRSITQI